MEAVERKRSGARMRAALTCCFTVDAIDDAFDRRECDLLAFGMATEAARCRMHPYTSEER